MMAVGAVGVMGVEIDIDEKGKRVPVIDGDRQVKSDKTEDGGQLNLNTTEGGHTT